MPSIESAAGVFKDIPKAIIFYRTTVIQIEPDGTRRSVIKDLESSVVAGNIDNIKTPDEIIGRSGSQFKHHDIRIAV